METTIYNLIVGEGSKGLVYFSMSPDFMLLLDIVYPDDSSVRINARSTKDLVAQFRVVIRDKYESEHVALFPVSPTPVEGYMRRFREYREAFLSELPSK